MKRSLTATLLITAVSSSALLSAGVAFADSLIATRCKDEAEKVCAGIAPGGGRLAKCLRGHEAELSEPCKAALAAGWQGT
jgi:hypothetical protein